MFVLHIIYVAALVSRFYIHIGRENVEIKQNRVSYKRKTCEHPQYISKEIANNQLDRAAVQSNKETQRERETIHDVQQHSVCVCIGEYNVTIRTLERTKLYVYVAPCFTQQRQNCCWVYINDSSAIGYTTTHKQVYLYNVTHVVWLFAGFSFCVYLLFLRFLQSIR